MENEENQLFAELNRSRSMNNRRIQEFAWDAMSGHWFYGAMILILFLAIVMGISTPQFFMEEDSALYYAWEVVCTPFTWVLWIGFVACFLNMALKTKPSYARLFLGYRSIEYFLKIVVTEFLQCVMLLLWFLLLIVPGIMKYAHEGLQTNLAISLHAPNDEIRNKLMPISKAYPLDKLMEAVKYYEKTAGRRVTFEYIMLDGVNDSLECAKELVALVRGTMSYINLIPYNPVDEHSFKRSSDKNVHKFFSYLM